MVLALQRSRMLVCLLSSDYLCDSNAVFVLEMGIQVWLIRNIISDNKCLSSFSVILTKTETCKRVYGSKPGLKYTISHKENLWNYPNL